LVKILHARVWHVLYVPVLYVPVLYSTMQGNAVPAELEKNSHNSEGRGRASVFSC
jgi:hypothetical protein